MYRHKEQKFWPYQMSFHTHYKTIQKNSQSYFFNCHLDKDFTDFIKTHLCLYFQTTNLRRVKKERLIHYLNRGTFSPGLCYANHLPYITWLQNLIYTLSGINSVKCEEIKTQFKTWQILTVW